MAIQKKSLIGNLTAAKKAIIASNAASTSPVVSSTPEFAKNATPHLTKGTTPHLTKGTTPHLTKGAAQFIRP